MPRFTGMPYKFAQGTMQIKFSTLRIDGTKHDESLSLTGGSLLLDKILQETPDWKDIEIDFLVKISEDSIKAILDCMPPESGIEDVKFLMTVYDREANRRWKVEVVKDSEDYSATVKFQRGSVFGAGIMINAYALPKKANDPPVSSFASSSSERISDSNEISVWLIEKPDDGKGLQIVFRRFSDQYPDPKPADVADAYDGFETEIVHRNPNAYYCLEIIEDKPILFLNDHENQAESNGFPFRYIRKLLEDDDCAARTNTRKRQQIVFHPVAQSIYLQLAIAALLKVKEEKEDDQSIGDYLDENKKEWQCKALSAIAKEAGGRTWKVAVEEWVEGWDSAPLTVMSELSLVLQEENFVNYADKVLQHTKWLIERGEE